jgi:uncharacterized membrane protein YuzA (DUF378 family)
VVEPQGNEAAGKFQGALAEMSRAAFLLFGLAAVTSILMQSAGPARAAENSFIIA